MNVQDIHTSLWNDYFAYSYQVLSTSYTWQHREIKLNPYLVLESFRASSYHQPTDLCLQQEQSRIHLVCLRHVSSISSASSFTDFCPLSDTVLQCNFSFLYSFRFPLTGDNQASVLTANASPIGTINYKYIDRTFHVRKTKTRVAIG